MSRRCQFCGVVLYGRSDKRYCSSTCRRDASRARTRLIRIGETTFVGSEWRDPSKRHLIPSLEREYGPNPRVVHRARRYAEDLREEKYEKLARKFARLDERDGD
jgi:hypothetical protein